MRIINPHDFRKIKDVIIERSVKIYNDGFYSTQKIKKKVGEFVYYKNRVFYLTHRRPEHFMRKFRGFGIDKKVLMKIIEFENELRPSFGNDFILFILFHYDGKNENRYYIVDPFEIIEYGKSGKFTKTDDKFTEVYKDQLFYPIDKMILFGYGESDIMFKDKLVVKK